MRRFLMTTCSACCTALERCWLERDAIGPCSSSIFSGTFVELLRVDCEEIPDCNEIVWIAIVCGGDEARE